jgi:hypothetical protein
MNTEQLRHFGREVNKHMNKLRLGLQSDHGTVLADLAAVVDNAIRGNQSAPPAEPAVGAGGVNRMEPDSEPAESKPAKKRTTKVTSGSMT